MQKPFVIDSPFSRVPTKASIWDCGRIDTCCCGQSIFGGSLLVSRFYKILQSWNQVRRSPEGPKRNQGAPRACHSALLSTHSPSGLLLKLPGSLMSIKIIQKFRGIWNSFGTDSLENQKQAKNSNWHWHQVNRLVNEIGHRGNNKVVISYFLIS